MIFDISHIAWRKEKIFRVPVTARKDPIDDLRGTKIYYLHNKRRIDTLFYKLILVILLSRVSKLKRRSSSLKSYSQTRSIGLLDSIPGDALGCCVRSIENYFKFACICRNGKYEIIETRRSVLS